MSTTDTSKIVSFIKEKQDLVRYKEQNWEGTFEEYLKLVEKNPKISRTAYQRIYDMVLSYGTEEYTDGKKKITRFHFFSDPVEGGKDAVYGLEIALQKMVNIFKSAAKGYGTERRVLLLHGPVGSSKSTIVRLLKKGVEEYSRRPEGALYTFAWKLKKEDFPTPIIDQEEMVCPMHEEPLHLVPQEFRAEVMEQLNKNNSGEFKVAIEGDLCPACRQIYKELFRHYSGDWTKLIQHVVVRRLLLSERDRIGIGTFQPKDEKNQDSTELTGDINYRRIAMYGSDSDPRAFNFDGEFNIANRGVIEFVEVLKLDVAFLYDLLGASQEHKVKPKKFPQTDIDEVIIGILELGDGVFEVISTSGDTYLGGDDFDDRIIDWAAEKFMAKTTVDLRKDRITLQQLKEVSEKAKMELSLNESTELFIPAVTADSNGFIDLNLTLQRREMEELTTDLVQRTFKVCDEAMQMARLSPSDIDGVILVGGPSRMPAVQAGVRHYFQREPLAGINPDEVVALGASIQGAALSGGAKDIVLIDLTPLSLGIEIRGGLTERVIEINTPVPADHTKIFTTSADNQETVKIRCVQGESRKAAENETLGELTLTGLRKAPAGTVSIAVQFEVDTNGILNVIAKDVETGKAASVRLKASGRLSDEKLEQLKNVTDAVVTSENPSAEPPPDSSS